MGGYESQQHNMHASASTRSGQCLIKAATGRQQAHPPPARGEASWRHFVGTRYCLRKLLPQSELLWKQGGIVALGGET